MATTPPPHLSWHERRPGWIQSECGRFIVRRCAMATATKLWLLIDKAGDTTNRVRGKFHGMALAVRIKQVKPDPGLNQFI